MKLLGWMHRKFRQNSNEAFKEFSIGNSCACLTGQPSLDDVQYPPKPNYCTKPSIRGQNQFRKSSASTDAARTDGDDIGEETSAALSEFFHGFLAIGTLGTDPVTADPSTPTFSISVENIMEKETEVTENELKLINDELEKVLGADEICNLSSGRNSHVSTGRSSHVSTGRNSHVSAGRSSHCSSITLGGKPAESAETNGNGTIVCPLQGYLLGSAIGLPETTTTTSTTTTTNAKKECRVSLGELFQKTKQTEDISAGKTERAAEKKADKESDKSAVLLVKKMLKRKILHGPNRNCMASGGTTDSASAETKLHKILHLFHRKVHPESSATAKKSKKPPSQVEVRSGGSYKRPYIIRGPEDTDEDIIITPYQPLSKERLRRFKSQSNPPQLSLNGGNPLGTGEHWIKTDSDYLVLEL